MYRCLNVETLGITGRQSELLELALDLLLGGVDGVAWARNQLLFVVLCMALRKSPRRFAIAGICEELVEGFDIRLAVTVVGDGTFSLRRQPFDFADVTDGLALGTAEGVADGVALG